MITDAHVIRTCELRWIKVEPFERFFIFRMHFDEIGGSLGEKFPNPSLRFTVNLRQKRPKNFGKTLQESVLNVQIIR